MLDLLIELGLASPDTVRPYADRCRDKEIPVFIDSASGVIFLQEQKDVAYYSDKEVENDGYESRSVTELGEIKTETLDDSDRRFQQFRHLTRAKTVCDFGTGHGLYLDLILPDSKLICGVEPNRQAQQSIRARLGPDVMLAGSIDDVDASFDVITCFHVLEHLHQPIAALRAMKQRLAPGGVLVVEVPHANNFLLKQLDSEPFRKFTLWSEHLILHTRNSLERFLNAGGFSQVTIQGFQRYGLENQLYWLKEGKPGGHKHWAELRNEPLNNAFGAFLNEIDQTDTLIALARP